MGRWDSKDDAFEVVGKSKNIASSPEYAFALSEPTGFN
jgi:hypothetical protein